MAATTEASGNDSDSGVVSVNGHTLDSLDSIERAFSHLKDDYNDGNIVQRSDGRMILTARSGKFQHLSDLLDAHADNLISIKTVYRFDGNQKIELTEYRP